MSDDNQGGALDRIADPQARPFPLFAVSIAFALGAQFLAAFILWAIGAGGLVDFREADPSETAAFSVLLATFFTQAVLVTIGVAREGFAFRRIVAGAMSLLFSASLVMIFHVALQCALYANCL